MDSRIPENTSESITKSQNDRKPPNSSGERVRSRRGDTEAHNHLVCIGHTHAHAERSKQCENDCDNSRRRQHNLKQVETAKLTGHWRKGEADAGKTMRMRRPYARTRTAIKKKLENG